MNNVFLNLFMVLRIRNFSHYIDVDFDILSMNIRLNDIFIFVKQFGSLALQFTRVKL